MITAEQARQIMPNISPIYSKIEKAILPVAKNGDTCVIVSFTSKEYKFISIIKSKLIELGYSISESGGHTLRISWKKL